MKVLGRTNNNKSVLPKDEITELLPTKTSQLTNDSNFITTIPSEYITEGELTTELNNKQDKLVSSTNIKTINNTSILGNGNITTPNTTYSEITDAEITAGTSSTARAITGRRAKKIIDTARENLVESNINNQVKSIFVGTQSEYDALPNKTGILAIIKEQFMGNFYIEYETSSGTQTQSFTTGALLRQFIRDNRTTFINNCKVVAKLPEITDCSSLFMDCTASSLDLSSFDTSNVTTMNGMFYNSQITTLDLSSFNTSNVTDMTSMFYNSRATTLDLSSFDTSNVTDMMFMFENSQATTGYARTQADADRFNASIFKPAGLVFVVKESEPIGIGKILFNTNEFKKVMFEGIEYTKIILEDEVIWSKVTEPDFYIDYETSSGTQYQEFDTGALLRQFIRDNRTTFINNCKVVAKLPEITDCSSLFMDCTASSLDLSSFDTSNVTTMNGMFYNSQITTLDLSSFNTSNVTDMTSMFYNSRATTLDLSSFDTSNVTDMMFMFENSQATTGYARTQADADRFNASIFKPAGLVFIVK